MSTCSRRTFIKTSSMLAMTGIVSPQLLASPPDSTNLLGQQGVAPPFFAGVTNRPEVIAHRGGNGQWPGETMMAYNGAANIRADVLEMDVYLTKDDQLVLMHDKDVRTTTNGRGRIQTFTLNDIQELNAGYRWADGAGRFPYQKQLSALPENLRRDLRVPSLREIFESFPKQRMVIEMKPADRSPATALCKLIREFGKQDNVLVASFSGVYMQEFRSQCREIATSVSLSLKDVTSFFAGKTTENQATSQASVVQAPHHLVTEGLVRRAKDRRLKLHAWTVNNSDEMRRMQALGVDGIITDYPGPLLALLNRTQPA